eukprot:9262414-Alexandrium_andersonii.AAC.1
MSASLVGSEMCIRDRSCSLLASTPLWPRASSASSPHRCPAGRRGRRKAVSYTHLTLPTICSV